jgi:MoaA/NifB/PqqE/SkfB family radical SAM enzyme
MLQTNVRGVIRTISKKPKVLSVGAVVLKNRMRQKLHTTYLNGNVNHPEQITIVVTDICNLRCKMCHYAYSDSPSYQLNRHGQMEPALFKKLMDEIPGRPIVTFTGGEPLFHPGIAGMIGYASRLHRPTSLTTNGWMLAKRAGTLCEAGLDLLVVSVDGPPEIHNEIRGRHSFERLQEGIRVMLSLPNRPLVFVNMTLTDRNTHCLPDFYEIARNWGVDGVNFNHLWMQTHEMIENYQTMGFGFFSPDEVPWETSPEDIVVAQLADALEIVRAKNRGTATLLIETPPLNRAEIACWYQSPAEFVKWGRTRCAWIRMKVWPNGSVKPCRGWQAGNIAEQHAMDIWHGEQFTMFRQVLVEHGTIPLCARCCYLAHR